MRFCLFLFTCLALACGLAPQASAATAYRYEVDNCPYKKKSWFDPLRMQCGTAVATEAGVDTPVRIPALRLHKRDAASKASPVVFINGGPGGRGVTEIAGWLSHPLLRAHDIVLFDARGSGLSEPKLCPTLSADILGLVAGPLAGDAALQARQRLVKACIDSVPPALRQTYATPTMAADVDAIRQMFGYPRINLLSVSYGTRTALAYAGAYPQHLDKTVLDSVVPPRAYYRDIGANFDRALEHAFAACEKAPDCKASFPAFRRDYHALVKALADTPLRLTVPSAKYANQVIDIDAQDFSLLVQQMLYQKEFISGLPRLVDEVTRGQTASLGLLFDINIGTRVRGLDFGAYYLVLGNDELPLQSGTAPTAASALTFFDDDLAALHAALPAAPAAPAWPTRLAGPVLVMGGAFDPVTAPAYGQALVSAGNEVRFLGFPAAGHTPSLTDECARTAMVEFFRDAKAAPSTPCLLQPKAMSWATGVASSEWPRNWIESVYYPSSLMPLVPVGALAVLYLLVGAVPLVTLLSRKWRARGATAAGTSAAARPGHAVAWAGSAVGVALLLGLAASLMHAATGPAPIELLFGFARPPVAYTLGLLGVLCIALTSIMAFKQLRSLGSQRWRSSAGVWHLGATVANAGLILFLVWWNVFGVR